MNYITNKNKDINILYLTFLILSIVHLFFSLQYHKLSNIDDAWVLSLYYNIYHNNIFNSQAIGNTMILSGGLQAYFFEYIFTVINDNVYAYRVISSFIGLVCIFLVYKIVEIQVNNRNIAIICATVIAVFEMFVQNRDQFFSDMLKVLNLEGVEVKKIETHHFRRGQVDEWRNVLTSSQQEKINRTIPAKLMHYFAWTT